MRIHAAHIVSYKFTSYCVFNIKNAVHNASTVISLRLFSYSNSLIQYSFPEKWVTTDTKVFKSKCELIYI